MFAWGADVCTDQSVELITRNPKKNFAAMIEPSGQSGNDMGNHAQTTLGNIAQHLRVYLCLVFTLCAGGCHGPQTEAKNSEADAIAINLRDTPLPSKGQAKIDDTSRANEVWLLVNPDQPALVTGQHKSDLYMAAACFKDGIDPSIQNFLPPLPQQGYGIGIAPNGWPLHDYLGPIPSWRKVRHYIVTLSSGGVALQPQAWPMVEAEDVMTQAEFAEWRAGCEEHSLAGCEEPSALAIKIGKTEVLKVLKAGSALVEYQGEVLKFDFQHNRATINLFVTRCTALLGA